MFLTFYSVRIYDKATSKMKEVKTMITQTLLPEFANKNDYYGKNNTDSYRVSKRNVDMIHYLDPNYSSPPINSEKLQSKIL